MYASLLSIPVGYINISCVWLAVAHSDGVYILIIHNVHPFLYIFTDPTGDWRSLLPRTKALNDVEGMMLSNVKIMQIT